MTPLSFALLIVLLIILVVVTMLSRRRQRDIAQLLTERVRLKRERSVARQRAAQAEAQLSTLGQAMLEAVIIVDRDLRVTYATAGARKLFEAADDAIDQSLIEFTRSSELDQLAHDVLSVDPDMIDTSDDYDEQISINESPYRVRATTFEEGLVLALSDVSELQRLARARRDMVANISHELRTPLTSIRLLLDNLLSDTAHSSKPGTHLQKIEIEVRTLQQMAQELLDLSQIESGQVLLRMVSVPLEQLVSETVERLMPQARHKQQTIDIEIAPDLSVLADPEQAARVIGNLLYNAIKFTPSHGQIWLRAQQQEEDIRVEVADSGKGIPPEDIPRVFERFFRGDRSRASGGTGLGLAIAKHIVEAHGGRIWVESEGRQGLGATFYFTLPAGDVGD